jgi:hypothetical protein
MSLVLNGGVGGSASTQYGYVDSRIVSALPATVSFWFKTGINGAAGGQFAQWVDKDETTGTYRMGGGAQQAIGPVFSRTVGSRISTASFYAPTTALSESVNVTSITTGATTAVGVEDASKFSAGEYVRLEGTFTGITGITSGREWRIQSIAGSTLTLALTSSGTWGEGLTATVRWSAWQPEKWNLGVLSYGPTSGDNPIRLKGGFLGNSAVTLDSVYSGISGQKPVDIFDRLDRFCVGGYLQSSGASGYFRGEIAHVAVWEYFPTAGEASELLSKAPTLVGWGAPLAYWPLLADDDDAIGSNDLTLVGSPDITSDGPSIQLTSGGGGGSGYLPTVMRAQPINLFGF